MRSSGRGTRGRATSSRDDGVLHTGTVTMRQLDQVRVCTLYRVCRQRISHKRSLYQTEQEGLGLDQSA